jgi:uncharacterized repeat protein (TIGR01451 family)
MRNAKTLLAASSLALSISAMAGSAHAAGVSAGTLIQNTATATYNTGTSTGNVSSNTVSVKVDQLLDVAVAGLNSSPVTATSTAAVLTYSITNTGNGTDSFNLTADPAVSGNSFDGVIQGVYLDTNGNNQYDAGADTLVATGGPSSAIAEDGSLKVFVVVSLPAGATDAQTSQVKLTATSVIGSGTPGTVFAGKGQGGSDAVVGSSTASQSALDSLIASLATVSLTKSAAIVDQFAGTSPVPGATVTYTIVAHVTGSGTAEGVHVADVIPANTTYQENTVTLNGTALTDASDGDVGTSGASGIDVALGNVPGGAADKTVTFKVKIN